MDSKFIVRIRKALNHLDSVSEWDISQMQKHLLKLTTKIEQTISRHPETGKRQLIANFNEIHKEYERAEVKVKHRLNELRKAGQDEYNTNFSNTKEVALCCEDALDCLLQLLLEYFPETASQNRHLYKKYSPLLEKGLPPQQTVTKTEQSKPEIEPALKIEEPQAEMVKDLFVKDLSPAPDAAKLLTLDEIKKAENKFFTGMEMEKVVKHFLPLTTEKSKNGKPFLTEKQLIAFLQRAFLNDTKIPKQTFNLDTGETGFVILRFYEFYNLAFTNFNEYKNRKPKYVKLLLDNFTNWNEKKVKPHFRRGASKRKW